MYLTNTNPIVYYEDGRLYTRKLYYAECNFASKVVEMCKKRVEVFTREEVETILDVICKKDNIELEEMQKEAVIKFNTLKTSNFFSSVPRTAKFPILAVNAP